MKNVEDIGSEWKLKFGGKIPQIGGDEMNETAEEIANLVREMKKLNGMIEEAMKITKEEREEAKKMAKAMVAKKPAAWEELRDGFSETLRALIRSELKNMEYDSSLNPESMLRIRDYESLREEINRAKTEKEFNDIFQKAIPDEELTDEELESIEGDEE